MDDGGQTLGGIKQKMTNLVQTTDHLRRRESMSIGEGAEKRNRPDTGGAGCYSGIWKQIEPRRTDIWHPRGGRAPGIACHDNYCNRGEAEKIEKKIFRKSFFENLIQIWTYFIN